MSVVLRRLGEKGRAKFVIGSHLQCHLEDIYNFPACRLDMFGEDRS
jgi:hypothetical protein